MHSVIVGREEYHCRMWICRNSRSRFADILCCSFTLLYPVQPLPIWSGSSAYHLFDLLRLGTLIACIRGIGLCTAGPFDRGRFVPCDTVSWKMDEVEHIFSVPFVVLPLPMP